MAKMSTLEQLDFKYALLSQREKIMVLLLAVGATCFVLFELMVAPSADQNTQLNNQHTALLAKVQNLDAEMDLANLRLAEDPNQPLEQRIARLEQRIAGLNTDFNHEINELIPPQQMPAVLETIFTNAADIDILKMASEPSVNLFAHDPNGLTTQLYQHGMELSFSGEYFAILKFLTELEQMDYQMYWHALDYDVDQYPNATVKLNVFTLSTQPNFIGV